MPKAKPARLTLAEAEERYPEAVVLLDAQAPELARSSTLTLALIGRRQETLRASACTTDPEVANLLARHVAREDVVTTTRLRRTAELWLVSRSEVLHAQARDLLARLADRDGAQFSNRPPRLHAWWHPDALVWVRSSAHLKSSPDPDRIPSTTPDDPEA